MNSAWGRNLFWIGLVLLVGFGIHELSGILLPFAAGSILAFLLNPLVERLAGMGLPRSAATLLVELCFFLVIALFVLLLVPLLQGQTVMLIGHVPGYLAGLRTHLDTFFNLLHDRLSADDINRLRSAVSDGVGRVLTGAGSFISGLLTSGFAIANILSLLIITPIVAFFLLRDWNGIIAAVDSCLPRRHVATIREQTALIHETLSGYMRGQASVCLIMGIYYSLGLTVIGLDYGLVVGLMVGCMIFIPFLGGLTGAALSVVLGLAQFGDWHKVLEIGLLFAAGQTLESNVVTPKLVGDRVNLHPVWMIFALLSFARLFGLVGVLIAVPFAAVLGVLVRFAVRRYLQSGLYDPDPHPRRGHQSLPPI